MFSLFYFYKNRKQNVLFFIIVALLNILFAFGVGYSILYKIVPLMSMQKSVIRSLPVFVFCAAVLAGYGYKFLRGKLKIKKYLKISIDYTAISESK